MSYINELVKDKDKQINSPMKDYFKGKCVFLTGGTGFLGQLYVEKLLRAGVEKIYLLTRSKKNISVEKRLEETFVGPQFSKLRAYDTNFLSRLEIVEGNLEALQLGIREPEQKLLFSNVNIVLHAAADVRFDEDLHRVLIVNLRGTRELLKLSEKMIKLEVFAYISTAYSNCNQHYVEEKFYNSPLDPDIMMSVAETCSKDFEKLKNLEIITDRIIRPWPNTYAFTKSLSEELVRRWGQKFPICVIRPSIVISTYEDPIIGWCNNIYGLNGVLMACGLGLLRVLPLKSNAIGDIVCADFVINSTLVAIWDTHKHTKPKTEDPEIYHVCSSTVRPTTWKEMGDGMFKVGALYPSKKQLWKPVLNQTTCPFMFKYWTILYHVIPAIFTDLFFALRGKKKRVLPLYRKVQKFLTSLKFFTMNEWIFETKNMKKLLNRMSPYDRGFFPSDIKNWNWSSFQYGYLQGLKVYIAHENLDDAEVARRQMQIYNILHYVVLALYYGFHITAFAVIANSLGVVDFMQKFFISAFKLIKIPIDIF